MYVVEKKEESWKESREAAATTLSNLWSPRPAPPTHFSVVAVQPISKTIARAAESKFIESQGVRIETREEVVLQKLPILLSTISRDNVSLLKDLNLILFPVVYNATFYRDVINTHPALLSRLATIRGSVIGAIACRKEVHNGSVRVYIMTLGILAPYRRVGLDRILQACDEDSSVDHTCLHVHVSNLPAIEFYKHAGFEIGGREDDYYIKNPEVKPPHAFFLRRERRS